SRSRRLGRCGRFARTRWPCTTGTRREPVVTEYTPTTAEVAAQYTRGWASKRVRLMKSDEEAASAEFDRWLARHDAEVAAKALRDAADDLTPGDDKVDDWGIEAGLLRARAARLSSGGEG